MIRSGNPVLKDETFRPTGASAEVMTIDGTVNKTGILLFLVIFGAMFTWSSIASGGIGGVSIFASILGFILAMVTIFKPHLAGYTAPAYAFCEGIFLGAVSGAFEAMYPGIVMQAVGLTFGTLFCLLGAYKSGMIKVTENFKLGLVAATGGVCLVYFVMFIMSFFGFRFEAINGSGLVGIGFNLIVVTIAALNLVMDFDFIEKGAESGAPKYMEWYGAFGLMVTLIWLYMEMLRLLAKLQDRR